MTPRKKHQLSAFLGALPNATALQLFAAIEADYARENPGERENSGGSSGLPHDDLLSDLRRRLCERGEILPTRPPTAKRIFFTPFEDFFVGRRKGRKTRARIARGSLDPIWRIMMTDPACTDAALAAAALEDAIAKAGQKGDQTDELTRSLFVCAEAGLGRIVSHTHTDKTYFETITRQAGGVEAFDDLQEIRLLLEGVPFLTELQSLIAAPSASLSEEQFYKLRTLFLSAHDQSKLLGGYVLLAMRGRLEKPWRALGVYYHLARGADERLVAAREEISLLPESLFEDLESMARALERTSAGEFDAKTASLRVSYFASYADGLLRQASKAGDNVFVNRIEACRDIAGEAHERFAEQALAALRHAMPVRHAGGASRLASLRPDIAQPLSALIIGDAHAAASFMKAAPDLAERLGCDAKMHAVIADEAREKSHVFAKDLVVEIRAAEGEERNAARRMLDQMLKACEPLLTSDEIGLLRDRAAAAAVAV